MTKNPISKILLTWFFLFSIIYSCNQTDDKDNKQADSIVKESIQNISSTPLQSQQPSINKDPENDVWNGNVYRNLYFKFRVEFPRGWEYDKGSAKNTVARAGNREIGATFSIVVKNAGPSLLFSTDITKDISATELRNELLKGLVLQNIEAKNFKIEKGYLNNFPAYLIEWNHVVKSGDREFIYLTKQIHCVRMDNIIVVGLNIPDEFYDNEMNKIYHRVIDSFKFEIAF